MLNITPSKEYLKEPDQAVLGFVPISPSFWYMWKRVMANESD